MDAVSSNGRLRKVRTRQDGRGWHPAPRAPLPAKLTDDEIVQLVNERARAGKRRNAQVERNVVIVWRTLERRAYAERSGHLATSRAQLVRALCGGIPKWEDRGDDDENAIHYGHSLSRWLQLLMAAGLIQSAGGVRRESDGSWWRTEVVLTPMAALTAECSAN